MCESDKTNDTVTQSIRKGGHKGPLGTKIILRHLSLLHFLLLLFPFKRRLGSHGVYANSYVAKVILEPVNGLANFGQFDFQNGIIDPKLV